MPVENVALRTAAPAGVGQKSASATIVGIHFQVMRVLDFILRTANNGIPNRGVSRPAA